MMNRWINKSGNGVVWFMVVVVITTWLISVADLCAAQDNLKLVFSAAADNDLYRVMTATGKSFPRYTSAKEAVDAAQPGTGVLILADGYPKKTTMIEPAVFEQAAKKNLRLYVEYPSALPDLAVDRPRATQLERVVVCTDDFGDSLKKMQLLAIHDCHFVELKADKPYLVAAKVAGFDTAVYGLDDVKVWPILFEHPRCSVLVSTTKLSQFVTARYATKDAMQAVWRMILGWLQPGVPIPMLDWTPTVRATYSRDVKLPADAVRRAVIRGVDWHSNAKLLLGADWQDKYIEDREACIIKNAPQKSTTPKDQRSVGDGEFGVLEGFSSRIDYEGKQPIRWWLRTDSNGESSLAFALRSKMDGDERSRRIAANLLDWVYFKSPFFLKDPAKPNFGLIQWGTGTPSLYGDNDIKIILGCLGTASVLGTDRWDEVLVENILGNFRTTGIYGFRGGCLNNKDLLAKGWQHYWRAKTLHYAPHYEAWIWASYLWLYDKTGYKPLLERTRDAIRMMMEGYPDKWRWTNGIQQERGRMLLTLAWLIRVDDQPQHRAWLKRIAGDMQKCQDSSGAIREELGDLSKGSYRPARSNAEYGTTEASLIEKNGDPVADMLYTCNFTFLGLHEAAAATGDVQYQQMADKLADFLVRIQITSPVHPELDGGWFRAFDFAKWDYWGSNADAGWGAWCIEVGWTQAWIPTVLALRELRLNLWDMSKQSKVAKHWEKCRKLMLPDEAN
ncbi:MAG: hypothetical protein PHR77_07570 [Kiritimatiellae bacterium]|nr:hypothetical protein [Kiritimatiellia bacterium]MDD5521013.1 hypothetical protein [Kiritimatiellia bacterium]